MNAHSIFQIHEIPSPGFATLGKALGKLKSGDTFETYFDYRILGPKYIARYYNYPGSLTTPPYSENVIWVVSQNLLRISQSQVSIFFKICVLLKKN